MPLPHILKRCLLGLGALCIVLLLISQVKILMFNDISVEPIALEDNPELAHNIPIKRPPVYLISYAGGKEVWFKNQNALALSALNPNFLD